MKIKLLTILLLLFTTGCWNYRELNEYAIVTGISIDYDNNKYEVSALFANGKTKEEEKSQITLSTGSGNTIYEAIKNISLSTPKDINISHLSVVIISEDVAKNGITPVLDYLIRDPQAHQNFYIVIAKDTKAKNILSVINPLSDYPSQNITSTIKITEQLLARVTDASFNKFVAKILDKGINPVANSIILVGNEEEGTQKEKQENSVTKAYTKLDKLAIFKEDKLIDWADEEESIGINMLLGNIKSLYLNIPCNDNYIVVTTSSYSIKNNIKKDKISVNINAIGNIGEVGCSINLNNKKEIDKIEKLAKNKMYTFTNKALYKAKSLKTDIFGYGNLIYKKYPRYFNSIDKWDNMFQKLDIDINISLSITNTESLDKSIGELKNE